MQETEQGLAQRAISATRQTLSHVMLQASYTVFIIVEAVRVHHLVHELLTRCTAMFIRTDDRQHGSNVRVGDYPLISYSKSNCNDLIHNAKGA